MKTYIFMSYNHSDERGYNRTVRVYRMKKNKPELVGFNDHINTASYVGDRGVANRIINSKSAYNLHSVGMY